MLPEESDERTVAWVGGRQKERGHVCDRGRVLG